MKRLLVGGGAITLTWKVSKFNELREKKKHAKRGLE